MARDLTPTELGHIYSGIEAAALEDSQRQERPRAVLLGGQPGSGKTGLAGEALAEFAASAGRGGAVLIDADRMRDYHPDYHALALADPEHAADLLHPVAASWSKQLTQASIDGRRNLVIDGTLRSPDDTARVARVLQQHGYTVEARVMAVPPDVSIAHARLRYEDLAQRGVPARVVNQKQHDEAYAGVPQSVGRLETEKLVDRLTVYDTYRREVYQNILDRDRLGNGQWKAPAEAAKTLVDVRERGRTHAERVDYLDALGSIVAATQVREQAYAAGTSSAGLATGPADRALWQQRADAARDDLAEFEQSRVWARAQAFDAPPGKQTLARFPELDGAYKQLANVRSQWKADAPREQQVAHEQRYHNTVAQLSEQIHRGEIPHGDVTKDESRRVIDAAARERNLGVREHDPDAAGSRGTTRASDHVVLGEVLGSSTHHTVIKVSEQVAVVYDRTALERQVQPGERIALAQGQPGMTRVMTHDEGQALRESQTRDQSRDYARDPGMDRSR